MLVKLVAVSTWVELAEVSSRTKLVAVLTRTKLVAVLAWVILCSENGIMVLSEVVELK